MTTCHQCGATFRAPRDAELRWLESHVDRAHGRTARASRSVATHHAARPTAA